MYVVIAYDVNVKRVNKVKKFLRRYLNWVQNSVFEGEVTEADLEEIKLKLKDIIDENEDMIIIYKFSSVKVMKREVIGYDKSSIDEII